MELRQYGKIIMKRIWFIIGFVLIVSLLTGFGSFYLVKPVYEASNKLIVNKAGDLSGVTSSLGLDEIDTHIRLINTYKEIILTPAIMDKVTAAHPELNFKTEELIRLVKVSSLNNTQVMTLTMKDQSYERAARTVNAVAEVFKSEIPSIMKVDNVTILNEAKLQTEPVSVNPSSVIYTLIGFIISLVVAVSIVILIEHLDDTVKSETDVEQYLELPTLAVVMKASKADMKPGNHSSPTKMGEAPRVAANHS
jgi:capsular polysaccharide biosynthesis protein